MFWETLWALVFGFTLSGVVQAFASKDQMRATLGSHRPSAIARASGYGMVSSSCSYAASAMTKSLVAKGADFTSAMVFMFASTNLGIELGIVMLWRGVECEVEGLNDLAHGWAVPTRHRLTWAAASALAAR